MEILNLGSAFFAKSSVPSLPPYLFNYRKIQHNLERKGTEYTEQIGIRTFCLTLKSSAPSVPLC
jgi:hypothetical protein